MLENVTGKRLEDRVIELPGKPPCMLDRDLARIYGVETRALNQARERNPRKFVEDVDYFQLTKEEVTNCDSLGDAYKYGPSQLYAYTKRGAYMFATILSTDEAIEQAISVVEGFCTYALLMEEIKAGRITVKPAPRQDRHERTFDAMRKELLDRSPLWRKMLRYKGLGLNDHEIALLVDREVSVVRKHVRRMEACGLLMPPNDLPQLQSYAKHFANRLN